jgi:hypothetical protein
VWDINYQLCSIPTPPVRGIRISQDIGRLIGTGHWGGRRSGHGHGSGHFVKSYKFRKGLWIGGYSKKIAGYFFAFLGGLNRAQRIRAGPTDGYRSVECVRGCGM